MGQSTEELRRDIATTRGDLGLAVDAISDRVSPGRVVERRKEKLAARWTTARESIMGNAADVQASAKTAAEAGHHLPEVATQKTQGAPMAAGAIAFGLGFLVSALFPATETEAQLAEKTQEMAQPAVDELKQSGQETMAALKGPVLESAQHLKEEAASSVQEVGGVGQDAVEDTKDAASSATGEVANQAQNSAENVRSRNRDEPGS